MTHLFCKKSFERRCDSSSYDRKAKVGGSGVRKKAQTLFLRTQDISKKRLSYRSGPQEVRSDRKNGILGNEIV